MVKHGWPAKVTIAPSNWGDGFLITHVDTGEQAQPDFWAAAETAVRIVGRTYNVEFQHEPTGVVMMIDEYRITAGGFVKKVET